MKFITFDMFSVAKAAEIAKAFDKVRDPKLGVTGVKIEYHLMCQGLAFPGQPLDKMVSITLAEVENNKALSDALYTMVLGGGTLWSVPVLGLDVNELKEPNAAVKLLESLPGGQR